MDIGIIIPVCTWMPRILDCNHSLGPHFELKGRVLRCDLLSKSMTPMVTAAILCPQILPISASPQRLRNC